MRRQHRSNRGSRLLLLRIEYHLIGQKRGRGNLYNTRDISPKPKWREHQSRLDSQNYPIGYINCTTKAALMTSIKCENCFAPSFSILSESVTVICAVWPVEGMQKSEPLSFRHYYATAYIMSATALVTSRITHTCQIRFRIVRGTPTDTCHVHLSVFLEILYNYA